MSVLSRDLKITDRIEKQRSTQSRCESQSYRKPLHDGVMLSLQALRALQIECFLGDGGSTF